MADEYPTPEVPRVPLPSGTLLMTRNPQQQLLWIDGLLPLPVGTRIQLDNIPGYPQVELDPNRFPGGRADAIVVGMSLWGTQSPLRTLLLYVELELPGEGVWPEGA